MSPIRPEKVSPIRPAAHARCSGQGAQEQEGQGLLRLAPCARPTETYSYEEERSSLNAQRGVSRLRVLGLRAMLLLQVQSEGFGAKPSPERIEVEASGSVPRVRGQAVWASRLRRAVMSPEANMLMQA